MASRATSGTSSPVSVLNQEDGGERESRGVDATLLALEQKQATWRALSPSQKSAYARMTLDRVNSLVWRDAEWEGRPWAESQLALEGFDAKSGGRDSHAKAHAASCASRLRG